MQTDHPRHCKWAGKNFKVIQSFVWRPIPMAGFRVVVDVAVMEKAEIPYQLQCHEQTVTPRKHTEESTAGWS